MHEPKFEYDDCLSFQSTAPTVIADASFNVIGAVPTSVGSISFANLAGGDLSFSRSLNVGTGQYENTIDNFGPLQQFAMLSASDMTLLLRDVGIFLIRASSTP